MNGLKSIREKKVITQKELSIASGIAVVTISRLETGKFKPSARTVKALAQALQMEPQELFSYITSKQGILL
jgi:transcriptional regulator with XRE-family HTH domain